MWHHPGETTGNRKWLRLLGLPDIPFTIRNPAPGNTGFHWSEIDPEWEGWGPEKFRDSLDHPIADSGFEFDMRALEACEACVMVMPCGRSAHLELGYAVGAGKYTLALLNGGEPELMYKMVDRLCVDLDELVLAIRA